MKKIITTLVLFLLINILFINRYDALYAKEELENISLNYDYINISGTISWKDESSTSHYAQNINVEIYDVDNNENNYISTVETNEYGYYSIDIENKSYNLKIAISISGANVSVIDNDFNVYKIFDNNLYTNCINSNIVVNFEVDINNYSLEIDKEKVEALYVHQGAIIGSKYVKLKTGTYLDEIQILYPYLSDTSMYNFLNICITKEDCFSWDTILHEYGHYVFDYFNACEFVGYTHYAGDCLNSIYGKDDGMKLAWSEGIASYFSISSQIEMNTLNLNINDVGNSMLNVSDSLSIDIEFPGNYASYGESNELAICAALFDFADPINEEEDESVCLGFDYIWNVLISSNCVNFSDFMAILQPEGNNFNYIEYGKVLSELEISPTLFTPIYDKISDWNLPTFGWVRNGGSVVDDISYQNNLFSIVFYKEDGTLILETNQFVTTTYVPCIDDWSDICNGNNEYVYWVIKAYQTTEFTTGYYYSDFRKLKLPTSTVLEHEVLYNNDIYDYDYEWIKFEAPLLGDYNILINSYGGIDIEIYTSVTSTNNTSSMIYFLYNESNSEETHFNYNISLNYKEIIYIKIVGKNDDSYSNFSVIMSCFNHIHQFSYKSLNRTYHILKCHCGDTSGTQAMHVVDPHSDNNITKKCKICGVAIIISDGDFYPVIGLNSNIVDLNLLNYEIESLKVVKKE